METIWMSHPDLGDRKVQVTVDQFEIHKLNGWEETDAPEQLVPSSVSVVFGEGFEPPVAASSVRERFVPDEDKAARTEALIAPPVAPVLDDADAGVEGVAIVDEPAKPVEATKLPPNPKVDNPHK